MTSTPEIPIGDIYSLADDKRLVYLGSGKARLEIKVYADRPWEPAKDNINVPPVALEKWIALKAKQEG